MNQKTHRLFFALWPDNEVRSSIIYNFSNLPKQKGRIINAANLHVTLHFIGQATGSVRDCLHTSALAVKFQKFQFELDRFGCFPKAKVLWMGSQKPPSELIQLHSKLGDALSECGYKYEKRPYSPHVTLIRKCIKPIIPKDKFTIPWKVNEFVLVESIQGVSGMSYQVIERYHLS